ncbi:MAG: MFS transporter [Deltaproteobacteria bacterium]|nr:MFS transporter [Deltaproteobacteria bacterium]
MSKEGNVWKVIFASSAGTLIEWYDFYIFGSLATIISAQFFPKGNETVALLSTLATFATGFVVRPFGALFFGRIGDVVGRKYAFLATLLIMGAATASIGLLPSYSRIGIFAPLGLLLLRLVQGLALGGEYGGAATYVAEHAPDKKRGFYTSFIQTTATLGLFVSIGVILIYDSFANPKNRRVVLIALFGATAGQGVVWYTGQFYALYYLQTVLKIPFVTSNKIVAVALLCATPFFVVFGALSDHIGRKKIIMTGFLLAVVFYYPIYRAMVVVSNWNPGFPNVAPVNPDVFTLTVLVFLQVFFVTMVYGPIAAFLVELFPTKIRYTSMSVPYHIGNGVFGGLVPFMGTALVASTGSIYAGLIYPITIAFISLVVGTWLITDKSHGAKLWDEGDA